MANGGGVVVLPPSDVGVETLDDTELVLFKSMVTPATPLDVAACTPTKMEEQWTRPSLMSLEHHVVHVNASSPQATSSRRIKITRNEVTPSDASWETRLSLKVERSASSISGQGSAQGSSIEPRSPATTVRSSPPENLTPPTSSQKNVDCDIEKQGAASALNGPRSFSEPTTNGNKLRKFGKLLRRLSGHFTTSGRVMPKTWKTRRTIAQDPEEESTEAESKGNIRDANDMPAPAADIFLPSYEEAVAHEDEQPYSIDDPAMAVRRQNVEGGVEQGHAPPTIEVGDEKPILLSVGAPPKAASPVVPSPTNATETALRAQPVVVTAGVQGLILPCAPTDEEKASYYKSERATILTCGSIAFCAVLAGMLLFTIASPIFYWFAAPTVFVFVYICFHYFGVSIWGKDFNPETHTEIVRKGEEEGYLPSVDIYLPVCNEPLVLLANTWNYVRAIDYSRFAVHVLDDGAQDEVRTLAAEYGFKYIRRDDRPALKKAGNLRYAFARTSGDVTAIFDADFCPRADFLRETVPYLLDSSIGIVQTPQFFRRRVNQTWIEQGAGASQEFFYRMVQVNLDRFNASVCVGSCSLYRRTAVEPFGGVAPIEHSEDMYTGYKMTELGYKIKYVPLNLAMGVCPDEPRSLFMQQYRWCMGTLSLVMAKDFWKSSIPNIHKLAFLNGLLYYTASALFIFLGPTPFLLLVWLKGKWVLWYYTAFSVPSIIFSTIIIPLWAKQDTVRRGMSIHRVKVVQCYAHIFAIKDRIMGTVAPWVPSGGGASRSSSTAYNSSVWLLLVWNILSTTLIIGGAILRMTVFPWYHFIAAVMLAVVTCSLSLSTLVY